MKTLTLTLLFGLLTRISLVAQDISTPMPTTEEEYNYLTKGYKIQLESGLDMKKGYELEEYGEFKEGAYSFSFKLLFRTESNELAGISVAAKSSVSGNTYYLCIPQNNEDLATKYYAGINAWDASISKAYAKVLSTQLAKTILIGYDLEKKLKSDAQPFITAGTGVSMSGFKGFAWPTVETPPLPDESYGVYEFSVKVDDQGYVISVTPLQRGLSMEAERRLKAAVQKLEFIPKGTNLPPQSEGKITFRVVAASE